MSTRPWEELAPQGPSALQTQKFSRRWRSTHVSGRTPTCGRRGPTALRASSGHSGRPGARGLSAEVTSHEHRCSVSLSLKNTHLRSHCYLGLIVFLRVFQRTKQDTPVFLQPSGHGNRRCPRTKTAFHAPLAPGVNNNRMAQAAAPSAVGPHDRGDTESQRRAQPHISKCHTF